MIQLQLYVGIGIYVAIGADLRLRAGRECVGRVGGAQYGVMSIYIWL